LPLTTSWQKCTFNFGIPTANSVGVGPGGDDAYFIQINYTPNAIINVNIAKPSFYLSQTPPTNDFDTYDQVNTYISSARTGDVRTSLNTFYPYGWVPMNGGTIGNASSNATSRNNIDTWPLFNLIWNSFKAYDSGGINPIAQMYTSGGATTGYGSSAIADFGTANNQLALTKSMGQVILGTVPVSALLSPFTTTFTASNSGGSLVLTAANNVNVFNGMPFYVTAGSGGTLPTGLSAGVIYYVGGFNGTNAFSIGTSFSNEVSGTYIAYTNAGTPPNYVTFALAGTFEGEYAHSQIISELAAHTHGIDLYGASGPNNTQVSTFDSTPFVRTIQSDSTGNGTPFNVTQPGTFYNLFMKL
jgi:hypothetical protein